MENITTIQVSSGTKNVLESLKDFPRETYEDVINKLIGIIAEENMELSEQTKKDIDTARKEIKAGKFYTATEVKKRLGL
jgi:predicted S18 family serine protease